MASHSLFKSPQRLENSLLILVLGSRFLTRRFLPRIWSRIGQATVDFKFHVTEMVNEERRLLSQEKAGGENIFNSLLRASEGMAKSPTSAGTEGPGVRGLTESEIYGNIFVYNFAGHDTIAITLNYALYSLWCTRKSRSGSQRKSTLPSQMTTAPHGSIMRFIPS